MHRKIVYMLGEQWLFEFSLFQGNTFLSMWGNIFVLIGYYLK